MSYLRQHSDTVTCDISKRWMDGECFDLQWAVEFGSMGTLRADSCSKPKHRAAVAEIHNARIQVEALYLPLVMAAFERVANKSGSGIRHDGPLGSLLHDSIIGRLL